MTRIFKNYDEFLNRADLKINGVSSEFAQENPNYESENVDNIGCWNCTDCRKCHYCVTCVSCSDCYYCENCAFCSHCRECWNCEDCNNCAECRECSFCNHCKDCDYIIYCTRISDNTQKDTVPEKNKITIPDVPNIHSQVLSAIQLEGNTLDQSDWHVSETSHCWGGWVVRIAGDPGRILEKKTSPDFAAVALINHNSKVKVALHDLFLSHDETMKLITECADKEQELSQ